jgi:hypothetical protein
LEVERGWRDMKTTLDLRPVFHRREDCIRAHILLCWLGLLLIRIAETTTGLCLPKTSSTLVRAVPGMMDLGEVGSTPSRRASTMRAGGLRTAKTHDARHRP